jgi:hypothetical protein
LVCSPIVEIPAFNVSSSEDATEDFKSTTSTWGSYCNKSAVAAAPCSGSKKNRVHFIPTSTGEIKVDTGRAPYASARPHTLGCCLVSHRLRYDTLPMWHSPLQHGLRQATPNTLGLGSWSTVSYLFRDRLVTRTGPQLSTIRLRAR